MEKKTATKEFEHLGINGRIEVNLFQYYKEGVYTHNVSSYVNNENYSENVNITHDELQGYVDELTGLMKGKIKTIHEDLQKPILSELESLGFEIGGEEAVDEMTQIIEEIVDEELERLDKEEQEHTMNSDEEEWDEDHALDMVMNDIVEELGEDEINEIIEETKNNDDSEEVSLDDW
jgi:hypothetical protein